MVGGAIHCGGWVDFQFLRGAVRKMFTGGWGWGGGGHCIRSGP